MTTFTVTNRLVEEGKKYQPGETIELSAERAKSMGDSVGPAGTQTKEVEAPAEDREIKKAPAKK